MKYPRTALSDPPRREAPPFPVAHDRIRDLTAQGGLALRRRLDHAGRRRLAIPLSRRRSSGLGPFGRSRCAERSRQLGGRQTAALPLKRPPDTRPADCRCRTKAATSPRQWPAGPMRPKSPAHRRMLARQRAVQERPTAYAESPRPLRHEGPTGRSAACPPGDRNVANAIARRNRARRRMQSWEG